MKLTGPHGGGKSYILFFLQIFILSEREEHREGMWLCGLKTSMEACGMCSERVGRLTAPGQRVPEDREGVHNRKPRPPASVPTLVSLMSLLGCIHSSFAFPGD